VPLENKNVISPFVKTP